MDDGPRVDPRDPKERNQNYEVSFSAGEEKPHLISDLISGFLWPKADFTM